MEELGGLLGPIQSVLLFVLLGILVTGIVLIFIYLSLCVVIVKQGTRKIVERLGVYRRTLKEGVHVIWRPFDKIAPIPWDVLSISQLDGVEFEKPDYSATEYEVSIDTGLIKDDIVVALENKAIKEARIAGKEISRDSLDVEDTVYENTGKDIDAHVASIARAKNKAKALSKKYFELGIKPSQEVVDMVESADFEAAEAAQEAKQQKVLYGLKDVRHYPVHQDPKRVARHKYKHIMYPLAENEIRDYIDLRERYFELNKNTVIKLSKAGRYNRNINFNEGSVFNEVITKDQANIGVDVIIFFYVTDCFMYYYGVEHPEIAMALLAISTLRNTIATLTLDEALQSRVQINKVLREALDGATNTWGIKVSRVEIKEFNINACLRKTMNNVLMAERNKRAAIITAEGKKQACILRAEGASRAIELTRSSEAAGYTMIAQSGLDAKTLKVREYEALRDLARGSATKIFLPSDAGNMVAGAHILADALHNEPVSTKEPVKEENNTCECSEAEAVACEENTAEAPNCEQTQTEENK